MLDSGASPVGLDMSWIPYWEDLGGRNAISPLETALKFQSMPEPACIEKFLRDDLPKLAKKKSNRSDSSDACKWKVAFKAFSPELKAPLFMPLP